MNILFHSFYEWTLKISPNLNFKIREIKSNNHSHINKRDFEFWNKIINLKYKGKTEIFPPTPLPPSAMFAKYPVLLNSWLTDRLTNLPQIASETMKFIPNFDIFQIATVIATPNLICPNRHLRSYHAYGLLFESALWQESLNKSNAERKKTNHVFEDSESTNQLITLAKDWKRFCW